MIVPKHVGYDYIWTQVKCYALYSCKDVPSLIRSKCRIHKHERSNKIFSKFCMGPQSQIFLLLHPTIILVANIDLCFIYFWVLDQFCFVSFTFKISFLPPLPFVFSNSVNFSAVAMKWVLRIHTYASIKFAWVSHVNRWNIFWISNVIVNGWIDEQVYVVGYISQS